MPKASDNVFPRFLISEGGSTATPAAGRVTVYAKADGLLYSKDDAGSESLVSGAGGGSSAFVGCVATRTTDQTGVANATVTAVVFNGTDILDTDAFHDPSTNPSRITIPAGKAGKYHFSATVIWESNATGVRRVALVKNGTTHIATQFYAPVTAGLYTQQSVSFGPVVMAETDYAEVVVYQNSGANRTLSGSVATMTFGCTFLGT